MSPPTDALSIRYADAHLLAIDKPTGLLVHRTREAAGVEDCALSRVRRETGTYVFPVHRLDRATSGVLLFARDQEVASALARAFACGAVHKRYLALVRGWLDREGMIDHPLVRDFERPAAGQPLLGARTAWRRLARIECAFAVGSRHPTSRYALVEARPETGRRQQIRRHFHHASHPVIGDTTHGDGAHNRAVAAWLGHTRLWLHARAITFVHPVSGTPITIEAPLGGDWQRLLAHDGWQWDADEAERAPPR